MVGLWRGGTPLVVLAVSGPLLVDGGELFEEILYYSAVRRASGKSLTSEDPKVNQIQEK